MAAQAMLRALRNRTFSSLAPSSVPLRNPFSRFISTLVLAEHEGGFVKPSSLSAVAAAGAIGRDNSISILLGVSGPSLQKAASHAASCHPSVSQVLVADADMLMHPLAETWAELVHLIQEKGSYSYIVAASNSFGKMCYHELQLILMFHLLLISLEYLNHESLSGQSMLEMLSILSDILAWILV